jgi:hypothetical protein
VPITRPSTIVVAVVYNHAPQQQQESISCHRRSCRAGF